MKEGNLILGLKFLIPSLSLSISFLGWESWVFSVFIFLDVLAEDDKDGGSYEGDYAKV